MAGDRTTTATAFYKQRFRDFMASDVPKASPTFRLIDREARKIEVGGASLNTKWSHERYAGVGMSALSEAGDFPTAEASKAINPTLGLAHMAFAVDFSGHLIAQGSSKADGWAGSWQKKKARELRDKQRSLLARFAMHDGTANWGTVSAVSGTTNGYIEVSGISIHFFVPGETLTIRDNTTGGSEQLTGGSGSGLIVDVDYENERVYLADVSGAAASDVIALSGFYDATVPNGIENIVADTGTIQGINRATVGQFMYRATDLAKSGTTALTSTDVDELRDAVQDVADTRGGEKAKCRWLGNRKMRRWATLATIGQNRFTDLDLTLGNSSVNVSDKDGRKAFIEDKFIQDGKLYAPVFSKWVMAYPGGMKGGYPILNGNSVLWQAVASSGGGYADRSIMYWALRCNVGADDFRCQGRKTGITTP